MSTDLVGGPNYCSRNESFIKGPYHNLNTMDPVKDNAHLELQTNSGSMSEPLSHEKAPNWTRTRQTCLEAPM